jgi:hypothetical protein
MMNMRLGAAVGLWLAISMGSCAHAAEPAYPRSADVSSIDGINPLPASRKKTR